MLLEVKNPFFAGGSFAKDKHRMINMTKSSTSPLQTYTRTFQVNLQILKNKYPNKQETQLKELLEQLQNNIGIVINIIEQEKISHQKSNQIQILEVQEEVHENQKHLGQKQPQQKRLIEQFKEEQKQQKQGIIQQNKLLKRSFMKLHLKMEQMRKELQEKQLQLQKAEIKVQKLKTANQLLLEDKLQEENEDNLNNMCIF